jgi:hypothetical protein
MHGEHGSLLAGPPTKVINAQQMHRMQQKLDYGAAVRRSTGGTTAGVVCLEMQKKHSQISLYIKQSPSAGTVPTGC